MLRPVGIVHPDAVGAFKILLLQGVEKLADLVFFRPIAEPPSETQNDHDDRNDENEALPLSRFLFRIKFFRVQERHTSLA